MREFIVTTSIITLFAVGSFFTFKGNLDKNPIRAICSRVLEKIYLQDGPKNQLRLDCIEAERKLKSSKNKQEIINQLRFVFARQNVSHLDLHHPREVERLWEGSAQENGIMSEYIDGELVVTDVAGDSPAHEMGLQFGDIIESIEGAYPTPQGASSIEGQFVILRDTKRITVRLKPRVVIWDDRPRIQKINQDQAVLKVPTFRAGAFWEETHWLHLAESLNQYSKIVVDLRGNPGGNFVAGLRVLSSFLCGEKSIGYILKNRRREKHQVVMPDTLEDEMQLELIDHNDLIELKTFANYSCISQKIGVLIDSTTASTAEMVAQALKDYVGAKIYGVRSSGQLLVGVWYDVPELGEGWRLSIPEAYYQSRNGLIIEGTGVSVDEQVYYDLEDFKKREDSWVKKLLLDLQK